MRLKINLIAQEDKKRNKKIWGKNYKKAQITTPC